MVFLIITERRRTPSRMLRSIFQDVRDRGYSASQTIARWEFVRKREKEHSSLIRKTLM